MIGGVFLALLASAGAADAAPRAMSADFCADQLVLKLADRDNIAALSPDADNDFSYMRREAAGLKRARPEAEEIVGSGADVVIRFWGGDAARLERLGLKVVTLDYASDFDAVKENVRTAAAALGEAARGRALVAEIDARLDALAAKGPAAQSALYVTPGGVTAGSGTMIDAIFNAAGVANVAAEAGLSYWPSLPAEAVVAEPPAFIVSGFFTALSEHLNQWSAARHPAFRAIFRKTPAVHLPADIISCPGWFSLDASEKIRAGVDAYLEAEDGA